MKQLAGGDWSKPKPNIIGPLVETGKFCSEAGSDIVNNLPISELKNIGPQCLVDIPDKAELDPRIMGKFSNNAYAKLRAKDYLSMKGHGNITSEQFSHLSEDVGDKLDSAISVIEPQDLTIERLSKLNAQFISHINKNACKGIDSKEKMQAIRPESLDLISIECLKEIPEAALLALSPDQILHLGPESKSKELLSVLEKLNSKLDYKQINAISKRLKSNGQSWRFESHAAIILVIMSMIALFA